MNSQTTRNGYLSSLTGGQPKQKWTVDRLLQVASLGMILLIVSMEAFILVPAISAIMADRKAERRLQREQTSEQRTIELSRKLSVKQQADLISQQEALRRLNEENAKLAESINKKLKGE